MQKQKKVTDFFFFNRLSFFNDGHLFDFATLDACLIVTDWKSSRLPTSNSGKIRVETFVRPPATRFDQGLNILFKKLKSFLNHPVEYEFKKIKSWNYFVNCL